MIRTRIRTIFYYSNFYIIITGSVLLAFLCNQGCRDDSKRKSALSTKKESLVGKPAVQTPKTKRPESNLPPPSDEVIVKLIDPGKKPLKNVRYRFRAGNSETAHVTISEEITIITNGKKNPKRVSPPVSFDMTASVDTAPKSEPSKLKVVFGHSSISNASPKAPSSLIAELLKAIDGIAGIQTVTDKGAVESTNIELPDGVNPALRNLWHGTQYISQNLVRFPEEPIGVGAQWEVTQDIDLTTSTRQTTKYELVTLNRRGGVVKAEIDQVGRPGLVREMSNKDIENYLDAFRATGKAQLQFNFGSGISVGEVTTTAAATYTAESDTADNTTEYRTVQTVETNRATSGEKTKK